MLRAMSQLALLLTLCAYRLLPQAATANPITDDLSTGPEPAQVRLSEILIVTPQPYDSAQVAEARHKADEIREAIRLGGSFADLAKSSSQGPTAALGGDVGCFVHGNLPDVLERLVFRMKVGDVSEVVRTKQGFVILLVSGRGADPCTDVEVLNHLITPEMKPYIERLRNKVRQRWYSLIPQSARVPSLKQGNVAIEFFVDRRGAVAESKVLSSSGDLDMDAAALSAVRRAGPFSALPSGVETDRLGLCFHFYYNPAKGTGESTH